MKRVIFLLLISFFLLSSVASAEEMFTNGGFETGNLSGWSFVTGYPSNLFYDVGSYARTGNYGVKLYGSGSGGTHSAYIKQTFDSKSFSRIYFSYNLDNIDNGMFRITVHSTSTGSYYSGKYTSNTSGWVDTYYDFGSVSNIDYINFDFGPNALYVPYELELHLDNIGTEYMPPSPQITTIQTRITKETFPLTGIIINDVNSTGGFPSEQGYVTLTPTNNSEKIYPITLTGNDLIDGFELQITATSSEVTATPITVNDLGTDRTYNIYLDGQFLEKIGEVTSYQYNMTSFSTHTLKVEYDYYVPPGGEDGGGSGPVPPPDEDIQPDEDEIIIEDDVITIGELTITKEDFKLLTIEQIEAMNVSQDTKDKLIAIKSINVNWWLFILVISLTGLIVEGSHKKGHESIIIVSFIGVVISAYKLGYF